MQKQGNLTGQELVDLGIVTNVPQENIAQHGVDLNLIKVNKLIGSDKPGFVPKEGKTELCEKESILPVEHEGKLVWKLEKGAYDIITDQGCKIPANHMLLIRQRSSLLRNGSLLHSSVFDAGFFTDNIGTVMHVMEPIIIEVGARVAQIYAHNSNEVKNLYEGQFQGDAQRK